MKQLLYIASVAAVLGTTACRKYVEIPPETQRQLKYTRDYQALLDNTNIIEKSFATPIFSSDDINENMTGTNWLNFMSVNLGAAYSFQKTVYADNLEDPSWQNIYKAISHANTVITEVKSSVEGNQADISRAYAEALVHRAYAYHVLVNLFGKQYDAATAAQDPGVPLVLENKFNASLNRASVARVYEQIEKDLNEALPDLPARGIFNHRPGKSAAFAMLSRVYLDKRAFSDAKRYADSALAISNTLVDLNTYNVTPRPGYFTKVNDPEIILSKTANNFTLIPISQATLNVYGVDSTKDLRFSILTPRGSDIQWSTFTLQRGYAKPNFVNQGTYVGPGIPEMYLIKAECEARAGNVTPALEALNTLRKKRIKTADYYDFTATTGEQALQLALAERRRELMGTGLRWFDQRRLQKDAGSPTVTTYTHFYQGTTHTLTPGSDRYTYAIGEKYRILNPEIEQNP